MHQKLENFSNIILELGKLFLQLVWCITIIVPVENRYLYELLYGWVIVHLKNGNLHIDMQHALEVIRHSMWFKSFHNFIHCLWGHSMANTCLYCHLIPKFHYYKVVQI